MNIRYDPLLSSSVCFCHYFMKSPMFCHMLILVPCVFHPCEYLMFLTWYPLFQWLPWFVSSLYWSISTLSCPLFPARFSLLILLSSTRIFCVLRVRSILSISELCIFLRNLRVAVSCSRPFWSLGLTSLCFWTFSDNLIKDFTFVHCTAAWFTHVNEDFTDYHTWKVTP